MNKQYAFIKDGIVVNTVMFDDPSEELLEEFKELHGVDEIIDGIINDRIATPGDAWNGRNFIFTQPFPSWVLDEEDNWVAPISIPEGKTAAEVWWDEEATTWRDVSEFPVPEEL
jgi:hypothetical protein